MEIVPGEPLRRGS